jgi:hypothetical protein
MSANDVAIWLLVAIVAFLAGQGRIFIRSQPILDPISEERLDLWRQGDQQIARVYRKHILKRLTTCYDMAELRVLAFDTGVAHEEIAGETVSEYAMEMLSYCERKGMLAQLLDGMR